jgi:hypothetical protein
MINQRDLALAYSAGVAFACEAIVVDPLNVARFTARSELASQWSPIRSQWLIPTKFRTLGEYRRKTV